MNKGVLAGMLIMVIIFSAFNPFAVSSGSMDLALKDQGSGIQFEKDNWHNVLENAKQQNKLVFLFTYASTCSFCPEILQRTFTNQEVGGLFNKNFINLAIDIEHDEIPPLAIGNLDRSSPIFIISDEHGNMIAWVRGCTGTKELIDFAKLGLTQKKGKKIYL